MASTIPTTRSYKRSLEYHRVASPNLKLEGRRYRTMGEGRQTVSELCQLQSLRVFGDVNSPCTYSLSGLATSGGHAVTRHTATSPVMRITSHYATCCDVLSMMSQHLLRAPYRTLTGSDPWTNKTRVNLVIPFGQCLVSVLLLYPS